VRRGLTGAYPALADAEFVVVDNLTYAGNEANLAPVRDHDRLHFIEGDIRDGATVDAAIRGADLVVHFAAESHVDRSIIGSSEFVLTNVLGTQTLLQAAVDHGVAKFVHVSTDEVYGSIDSGSWPETHPVQPNSPYSASKASSDLIALSFHRTHQLDVRVTRCSNNYGPYQYPEKVIPLFVTNLIDGKRVPLYGDGANVRDWTYVVDNCVAQWLVLTEGQPGEIYNVGAGNEMSNKELTYAILERFGLGDDMIEFVADRPGHDLRYSVDTTKVRQLGWKPEHSFGEALDVTIAWYRDNEWWWRPLKERGASRRQGLIRR
jgi:dTDP-glucose 4,6-dehydratase